MERQLSELERVLNYKFDNRRFLEEALTHSSYANEVKSDVLNSNERFEFLGDSVLSIVVSDYLFKENLNLPEGELTKLRSQIVCEGTLADVSRDLEIGEYMIFGKGEIMTGGRERVSILADAFEAVIASIYLDGGLDHARTFILDKLSEKIRMATQGEIYLDYKTRLQEIIQSKTKLKLKYEIVGTSGPDHNKTFESAVKLNETTLGVGSGRSKKEAEQKAACAALKEANNFEKAVF